MDTELGDANFQSYEPIANSKQEYGFGIFTLKCLGKLLKIVLSKKVCIVFVALICLMALLEQFLVYQVGVIPSKFFKALGDKDWRSFWMLVLSATLLIIAVCVVISCKKYIVKVFYVMSRETLTLELHRLYFSQGKFYFLNAFRYDSADNPDQRITQDVDKFCNQFSSIINPFVIAPFTISYYSYTCYQTTGWVGPVSIFGFFILSAVVNKFTMKPIITRVMKQEKFEGFFRFKHMHVRSNAESMAFQGAGLAEMCRANSKLTDLINMQLSLYLREFPLEIAVNVSSYFGSILSYLILAVPVFDGKYDNLSPSELSALISKNAFVSIYLISCFSNLINLSTSISEIGGLSQRVSQLLDVMNEDLGLEDKYYDKPRNGSNLNSGLSRTAAFELKDVTICPPNETKPLVSNLNLEIRAGSSLLICGNSSSGKTSIFRVIKGLWPVYSGKVMRNMAFQPSSVFFLPQHSLLSDGSLLEQIMYPLGVCDRLKMKEEDLDMIIRYLKLLNLDHVLEKTGLNSKVDWNWNDNLSPGEAQRLSFVRLFYHRPVIAFVDEASSSLGMDMENRIYKICKELNITMISIGHRESLLQYHESVLCLDGKGDWTLNPVHYSNDI